MIGALLLGCRGGDDDPPAAGPQALAPAPAHPRSLASTAVDAGAPPVFRRGELDPVLPDAAPPRDDGAAVACRGGAFPLRDRALSRFVLRRPRGRDVKVRAGCPGGHCAITVTYRGASLTIEPLNGGDRLEDESVSRGDFDTDGREDLAVRVRVEADYGPDDSGMALEYRELAIIRLDPLEVIWHVTGENIPPASCGSQCTSSVTVSDTDCDGIRDRIDEQRTCHSLLCDSTDPTDPDDPFAADCADDPAVIEEIYLRDADGRFGDQRVRAR